jgi:hypothetical protein
MKNRNRIHLAFILKIILELLEIALHICQIHSGK